MDEDTNNNNDAQPLEPWLDPALEARIVALVLGEASEFESAELHSAIEAQPELRAFYDRIRSMHLSLQQSEKDTTDASWKLPTDKRSALLETFRTQPESAETEPAEIEHPAPANKHRLAKLAPWLGIAAAIILLLVSVVPLSRRGSVFTGAKKYSEAEAPQAVHETMLSEKLAMADGSTRGLATDWSGVMDGENDSDKSRIQISQPDSPPPSPASGSVHDFSFLAGTTNLPGYDYRDADEDDENSMFFATRSSESERYKLPVDPGVTGDWDSGIGAHTDGAHINRSALAIVASDNLRSTAVITEYDPPEIPDTPSLLAKGIPSPSGGGDFGLPIDGRSLSGFTRATQHSAETAVASQERSDRDGDGGIDLATIESLEDRIVTGVESGEVSSGRITGMRAPSLQLPAVIEAEEQSKFSLKYGLRSGSGSVAGKQIDELQSLAPGQGQIQTAQGLPDDTPHEQFAFKLGEVDGDNGKVETRRGESEDGETGSSPKSDSSFFVSGGSMGGGGGGADLQFKNTPDLFVRLGSDIGITNSFGMAEVIDNALRDVALDSKFGNSLGQIAQPDFTSAPAVVTRPAITGEGLGLDVNGRQAADRDYRSRGSIAKRDYSRRLERIRLAEEEISDAENLLKEGDTETALARYSSALEQLPKAPMTQALRDRATAGLVDADVDYAGQLAKQGKFPEARQRLETTLSSELAPDHQRAKKMLARLDDPEYYNQAITPGHVGDAEEVERKLKLGTGFYDIGRFDKAEKLYNEALRLDPYNETARRGMKEVELGRQQYFKTSRDHMRGRMLSKVDALWEWAVPPVNFGEGKDETAKVDTSVASGGAFWDVPRINPEIERANRNSHPTLDAFFRYPGHPAGITLQDDSFAQSLDPTNGKRLEHDRHSLTTNSNSPEFTLLGAPRISIWNQSDKGKHGWGFNGNGQFFPNEHASQDRTSSIRQKLKTIKIPEIDFTDATLDEAIDFLRRQAAELDTDSPPDEKGVNIIIKQPSATDTPLINLTFSNITLEDALRFTVESAGFEYRIDPLAAIVVPSLAVGDEKPGEVQEQLAQQKAKPDLSLETLTADEPFSTFSLNVSDVSFKLASASLLEQNVFPPAEKIRVEEFVNAFDYGDPAPTLEEKVACQVEQSVHPFLQQRNLMRVSMRTAAAGRAASQPLRLTILLDKSGSMERADREESVLRTMQALAKHLGPADQVSAIAFARQPHLIADRLSGDRAGELVGLVAATPSAGGTNLEEALKLAQTLATRQFEAGGINRIVLITDGAANLGDADPESLKQRIIKLRQQGIAFDACGVGADGLNDATLEALTRKGDGRYYFLDRPEDADANFVRQLAGSLRPAAKNIKVQVKFNPARVTSYRLAGFEKHRLDKEDFRNDKVDAAEMAAAESGNALYQFEADPQGQGDIGEVSVRFLDTDTNQMVERSWPIPYQPKTPRLEEAAPSMQLAATAGLLAEKLKGGAGADVIILRDLATTTNQLRATFQQDKRVGQLIQMVEKTRSLSQ